MKIRKHWMVVLATLALILTGAGAARSDTLVVELAQNFSADPIVVSGTSGGLKKSNCGSIAQSPNHVVKVTSGQINYMRMSVKAEGEPTLVVEGPGGRFCVLADKDSGEIPQMSGVWAKGNYSIYVGDRSGGKFPYTLSFTQRRD